MDYNDLEAIKAKCRKLTSKRYPSIVVKHPGRDNYNITHKSRTDLYTPDMVVYDPNT